MDRSHLKFSETVLENFSFLEKDYLFTCAQVEQTFVRYESSRVFVNIYHGRGSFEIGGEIGLINSKMDGGYGIGALVKIANPEEKKKYFNYTTDNPDGVKIGVRKMATILLEYGDQALRGKDSIFKKLEMRMQEHWNDHNIGIARREAVEAFKKRSYNSVVELYSSIEEVLTPAEAKKLQYAKKKLLS